MKKLILSLILFLLILQNSQAEIKIKKQDHMENDHRGLCAWCAVETLARTHGWVKIKGLTKSKNRSAWRKELVDELKKRKIVFIVAQPPNEGGNFKFKLQKKRTYYFVKHQQFGHNSVTNSVHKSFEQAKGIITNTTASGWWWIEEESHWDITTLEKAARNDLGAVISLNYYEGNQLTRHMVVLTDISNRQVKMVDSNQKAGKIRVMPLCRFLHHWNGFSLIIKPKHRQW